MSTLSTPLLLLPGTGCDGRVFGPLMAGLSGYPIIIGDMTGARSAPEQARRILRDAPETFALAGFSLGGIVALEIMDQDPGRVSRLALIDANARAILPESAAARRAAAERARTDGIESFIMDGWPAQVGGTSAGRQDLQDILVDMARAIGAENLADQTEIAINRADSIPRLKAIAVPTLIVAGSEDGVCPPPMQQEMATHIPGAHLCMIPGAGHFALLEKPEAVIPAFRTWLGLAD